MPTFEIQVPDGRTLDIEAETEEAAISGAQSWVSENPLAAPQAATGQPVSVPAPASPDYAQELARIQAERSKPRAPTIAEGLGLSPEQEAAAAAENMAAKRAEAEVAANRTIGERAADTGAFAASLPVRMATKGDYGASDVARMLGFPSAGDTLQQGEADFAKYNAAGLEAAKAIGDVTAGIPALSTMGAVPGQVLRTGAAAARQLPGELRRLAGDVSGTVKIPGAPMPPPTGGAAPPIPPVPPVATATPQGPRLPSNAEVIDAAKRIDVPLLRAMVGNRVEQGLAGGLSAIPYAGTPIVNAFERGRQALGDAAARTVSTLGQPGTELAGGNARDAMVKWVSKQTADELNKLYKGLGKKLKPGVTRPLEETRKVAAQIQREMAESTSVTPQPALNMVDEALQRREGLSFNGVLDLRTDVIRRLDAAKISPEAGTDMAALKRLKTALTKDLQATVEKAGGKTALDEFKQVNDTARRVIKERKSIERIVGPKGDAGEGAVINRVTQMASTTGQNLDRLRIAKKAMGNQAWNDMAAEISNRMGIDTATGQWSHNRFMTAYGKLSDAGKSELFGAAKPMFDDIATVSSKFKELEKLGNPSGTGRVNAVMKLITNPGALLGGGAAAYMANPALAIGAGVPTLTGFAAGRRMAWYLASPPGARQAGKLIKSYYGVESALKKGGEALVRNEEALDSSIRSFAAGLAADTGQSAAEVEKNLRDAIAHIRRN